MGASRLYMPTPSGGGGGGMAALFGAGVPAPATGNVNDIYFDTTAKDIYKKTAPAVWTLETSYADTTLLFGAGAPAPALGIVGDSYFDTTANAFYKKTGAFVWTLQKTIGGVMQISATQRFSAVLGAGATTAVLYTVPANRYAQVNLVINGPTGAGNPAFHLFLNGTRVGNQRDGTSGDESGQTYTVAAGTTVQVKNEGTVGGTYELSVVEFSN